MRKGKTNSIKKNLEEFVPSVKERGEKEEKKERKEEELQIIANKWTKEWKRQKNSFERVSSLPWYKNRQNKFSDSFDSKRCDARSHLQQIYFPKSFHEG